MAIEGYLLDTCILSALLDPTKRSHSEVSKVIGALNDDAPKYVSVITIAELHFGIRLATLQGMNNMGRLEDIIHKAKTHPPLEVTKHTAEEYGYIKAELANKYLRKLLKKDRPRWIEDWVDKATGQKLHIDENDLWLSAQAKERNLILMTAEKKINRISNAVPSIRVEIIK